MTPEVPSFQPLPTYTPVYYPFPPLENQLGRIGQSSAYFSSAFPHQNLSPQPSPFILCKIEGNISTDMSSCLGCNMVAIISTLIASNSSWYYMCIRHQEWREYMPQGSQIPKSRFGNVYYHFQPRCIWVRCSWFNPSQLEVPPELLPHITSQDWLYLV